MMDGIGKYAWANGAIYEGSWKCNKMHGEERTQIQMGYSGAEHLRTGFSRMGKPESM